MKALLVSMLVTLGLLGCDASPPTLPQERTFVNMTMAGNFQNVSAKLSLAKFDPAAVTAANTGLMVDASGTLLTTAAALQRMESSGLEAGTFERLTAYAVAMPHLLREGPIVALGSPWRNEKGHLFHPAMYEDHNGRRSLYMAWDDEGSLWSDEFRFLVYRP